MVSQVVSVLTFAGVWGEREPSADLTSATGSGRQPTVYRLKEMRDLLAGDSVERRALDWGITILRCSGL